MQILRHKYPLIGFPLSTAQRHDDDDDDDYAYDEGQSSAIPRLVDYNKADPEEVDLHVIFMLSALGCTEVCFWV